MVSGPQLHAQRAIGVKWKAPDNTQAALAQLQRFDKLGIQAIEVNSTLSPAIWRRIDSLQLNVYGHLGIRFPTTSTFAHPDSALISQIQQKASVYLSQPSVSAIGLFDYGAVTESDFWQALQPIAQQLRKNRQLPLYFAGQRLPEPIPSAADFAIYEPSITTALLDTLTLPQNKAIRAYFYSPSQNLSGYLHPFKKFMDLTSQTPAKLVFVDSAWLISILHKYPEFTETLRGLTSTANPIFPLPEERLPTPEAPVLPVLLLLAVWGSLAFYYHSSPLYRKSLFRYFTAHKFFINDIFQRQMRSPLPALIILMQNALLIGASFFAAAEQTLSPHGEAALFYHFRGLAIFGANTYSLFGWILLGTLLISVIGIIWLYVSHKSITSLTQIAIMYAWPLHLNILLCTISTTLFAAGAGTFPIVFFTGLALAVFIATFCVTALDMSRFSRSVLWFQIKTNLPYLLTLGGITTWLLLNTPWREALSLAIHLK